MKDTATAESQLLVEVEENPDFLLYVLDMPIAFHRAYIPLTGKVTAALMLSWAVQVTEEVGHVNEGWFGKSIEEWTSDIGLSKDELITARKRLEELGLIEVRRERDSADKFKSTNEYRVSFARLTQMLKTQAQLLKRPPGNVH